MNMADVITCFGKRLTICNPSGLQELINFCKPNTKWQKNLDTYYNNPKGIYDFEHHKDNCKLLSSLKNRIFADFEWQLLKEKWDAIKENFSIVESCDEQKVKEKYQNVTKIFTKEVWKKNREDKRFSCPYAEINRVYVGLNRGSSMLLGCGRNTSDKYYRRIQISSIVLARIVTIICLEIRMGHFRRLSLTIMMEIGLWPMPSIFL